MKREYIEVPGNEMHELPPLLVHTSSVRSAPPPEADFESVLVEAGDMLGPSDADEMILEQRKFDLAVQLTERYRTLLSHWCWGDSVLEWIRQCEITFECKDALRHLLHTDIWPHASRASFVTLLGDKAVTTHGVELEKAVGLRLTFRQPPPIDCFSNQFLFYLNSTIADTAYRTWSGMMWPMSLPLPPERFHFEVVEEPSLGF